MTNVAVVISVSEYIEQQSLLACKNDGEAMAHLLRETGRFDQILVIESDTQAALVKGRLSDFINKIDEPLDEFFFYFSGHGDFDGTDFSYILSDYSEKKRKQTSLSNEELDGMVRSVSPKLYVKVVDACNSGVPYIKSNDEFIDHLKLIKGNLTNVYFMFSSGSNQYSYQDDKISYFTDSFVKSIVNHPGRSIRYKDIMSFVSDDFANRGLQTPVFVAQASLTEIFCEIPQELKRDLKQYIKLDISDYGDELPLKNGANVSLLEAISKDATRYVTREAAMEVLSEVQRFLSSVKLSEELGAIFDISFHVEEGSPPSAAQIGRWLMGAKDQTFFAKPDIEIETYQKRVPKHWRLMNHLAMPRWLLDESEDDFTYVDAKREVVSGFRFTSDMPFGYLRLRMEPKYLNVAPEEACIVLLLSMTSIKIFYSYAHFEYIDWEKSRRVGTPEWIGEELALRDREGLERVLTQIPTNFFAFVYEPMRARWAGTEASEEIDTSPEPQAPRQLAVSPPPPRHPRHRPRK